MTAAADRWLRATAGQQQAGRSFLFVMCANTPTAVRAAVGIRPWLRNAESSAGGGSPKDNTMYIGVGAIVLIIILVLLFR